MVAKLKMDPKIIFDAGLSLATYTQDSTERIESIFASMGGYSAEGWAHRSPLRILTTAQERDTENLIANTAESGRKLQDSATILTEADLEAKERIDRVLEELED